VGAHRDSDEGVEAGADPTVEQDKMAVGDGSGDARHGQQAGERPVQLPAAVVGHDDTCGAALGAAPGIRQVEHAFHQDRKAGAAIEVVEVVPGEVAPRQPGIRRQPVGQDAQFAKRAEVDIRWGTEARAPQ
jgi:hypothetical protein